MDREPEYICLPCLPRKNKFTGFGLLRGHLRRDHRQKWLSENDSNRYRCDGGYIHDRVHYYPGQPGYERWRAIGYNMPKVERPRAEPPTEPSRGINLTPAELSQLLASLVGQVNQGISVGVGTTIQGAAALANLIQPSAESASYARSVYPVPSSNNVMVSITNPVPSTSAISGTSNAPAIAGPSSAPILQAYQVIEGPPKSYTTLDDYVDTTDDEQGPITSAPHTPVVNKSNDLPSPVTENQAEAMDHDGMEKEAENAMKELEKTLAGIPDVEITHTIPEVASQAVDELMTKADQAAGANQEVNVNQDDSIGEIVKEGRQLAQATLLKVQKADNQEVPLMINFVRDEPIVLEAVDQRRSSTAKTSGTQSTPRSNSGKKTGTKPKRHK